MSYEIVLSPEAIEDLRNLKANICSAVRDGIETHLRFEPTTVSKSRIKRLQGVARPQYRLRVDEIRIFYDVIDNTVEILGIVPKSEADNWLQQVGESDERSDTN